MVKYILDCVGDHFYFIACYWFLLEVSRKKKFIGAQNAYQWRQRWPIFTVAGICSLLLADRDIGSTQRSGLETLER